MAFAKPTTVMLLCSIAFVATPASARTLKSAPDFSTSLRASGGPVEFTDMSAKRRHNAVRHHARRHQAARHSARYRLPRHARAAAVNSWGHGAIDQHSVVTNSYAPVAAYSNAPVAPNSYASRAKRKASAANTYASAANSYASVPDQSGAGAYSGGGGGLVAEAKRYMGTNPTGRGSLWCGHFMNMVLERSGHRSSGSNTARSFASYGTRISGPQVGAIAVMSRGRGGGHVGVVSGIDPNGNPIIVSGNHNRRVAESVYPRGRIFAYVMP